MVERGIAKAIISRVVQHQHKVNPETTFKNMLQKYPGVFCYYISSEETGTWMGATPEKLFNKTEDGTIQIHSLAGTQPAENINWTEKEFEEQQLVTEYIANQLTENGYSDFSLSERETIIAGSVAHLRSTFTISSQKAGLNSLVELLHPTPAVCGTPKDKAVQLIKETEKHSRNYYTGFLGTLGKNLGDHLFVNLRCMELTSTGADLYVGGGITAASEPEKEWKETELKAKTLLSVIS